MTLGRMMAAVAVAMTAAGCGAESGRNDRGEVEIPMPDGIYVDRSSTNSLQDGSLQNPFLTINEGLRRAYATGKNVVYVYRGTYSEVVELLPGVTVQGSLCRETSLVIDNVVCASRIEGGSPVIVAHDLAMTAYVQDFVVTSLDANHSSATYRYQVPGLGCVGRATSPVASMPACEVELDDQGRAFPDSSIAIAVQKADVTFQRVDVNAGRGGDGAAGANGAIGEAGLNGSAGTSAGSGPAAFGKGGLAPYPAACPDARGGNGGNGGQFIPSAPFAVSAQSGGSSEKGTLGGVAVPFNWRKNFSDPANVGAWSENGLHTAPDGETPNAAALDPLTLTAPNGGDGMRGAAGAGGGGGAGGAGATRKAFRVSTNGVTIYMDFWGLGGATGDSGKTLLQGIGELAGGGGGSGGSGGCGGEGGRGGQGGGSSVGIHATDSQLRFLAGSIWINGGGQGGKGGIGGVGGVGGNGGARGDRAQVSSEGVTGNFDANGEWILSATSPRTSGKSAAISAGGGWGGNGGRGKTGGFGRGGAGGASIGIITRGSTHAVVDGTHFTVSGGGPGGFNGYATGPNGHSAEMVSLAP